MCHGRIGIKAFLPLSQQARTPMGKEVVAEAVDGKIAAEGNPPPVQSDKGRHSSPVSLPASRRCDRPDDSRTETNKADGFGVFGVSPAIAQELPQMCWRVDRTVCGGNDGNLVAVSRVSEYTRHKFVGQLRIVDAGTDDRPHSFLIVRDRTSNELRRIGTWLTILYLNATVNRGRLSIALVRSRWHYSLSRVSRIVVGNRGVIEQPNGASVGSVASGIELAGTRTILRSLGRLTRI